MALGGGSFLAQNKVLPGAYVNFVSVAGVPAEIGTRGYAAMGLDLNWGEDGKVIEVSKDDFFKNSRKIFGYEYTHEKLKGIRDLFKHTQVLYAYRLNTGGTKADNTFATALYTGERGNDIKIVILTDVDTPTLFEVQTWMDGVLLDAQKVKQASELVANGYVSFKSGASLRETAMTPLTGGGSGSIDTASHQAFLDRIEAYPAVNAIGYVGTDTAIKKLYMAFTKRMRDEVGVKFQTVLYTHASDYEGCVNVKNRTFGDSVNEASLVYWVTGVIAGTQINTSATNALYDGEYEVSVAYRQKDLEDAIKAGEFVLHQVGSEIRILSDINSLVTTSQDKGVIFKDNQTVRVCDQVATDIARLFVTKYLGSIPNDAAGRISLWADIVKHHEELQNLRAVENFTSEDIKVAQGEDKKSVVITDNITVVNTMEKLYMTVYVA